MKIAIGILSTIVVITGTILTFLSIWDIYPISWLLIVKAAITVALICVAAVLLWLIRTLFFKGEPLNKNKSNQSQHTR
ncbi:hypothetical protein [Dysgonomonas sp. 25]|uniref:hypothetical protein n=1 Tax=Dysgonomonas sp. 25 TaxID=2302933 RepID=UPI0013D1E3AB|nr:hypothetical protein [Dysgonomonas sp. 25]NDV69631.1 hypothetical protein [Dysgonomonas sp. 25]